ncbi:GNAT family N-acetyltransferase [Labilibacter sediminis]|nr:GNAT family N-acetyltransferase [Labilibacter sediminis]
MVVTNVENKFELVLVDLNNTLHTTAFLSLMNDYMLDNMGLSKPISNELRERLVPELLKQSNYLGFMLKKNNEFIALANTFVGFSTFKAQQLINIHDFIVTPNSRKLGAGKALLDLIVGYAKDNHFCKVTLEVRHDNEKAQSLYERVGFVECDPPMYFWQKTV